jgi:2-polyprenyl-6-methoxyphenol hydroxylase-like FAD-dependent oxidoreductase
VAHLLDEAFGHDPWPVRADAILAASFRATPPLTRSAPLVAGASGRILRVGDAAGYVEPFTGEGMGWALTSARILAEAVDAPHGLRAPAGIAARYVAAHRLELQAVHARCRLVARGLRRPAVVATAVTAARAVPWAARRIVPLVIGAVHGGGSP